MFVMFKHYMMSCICIRKDDTYEKCSRAFVACSYSHACEQLHRYAKKKYGRDILIRDTKEVI